MSDILTKIIATKHDELAALMREKPLSVVRAEAEACCNVGDIRDFAAAIEAKIAAGKSAVIAEIKKASPSKGILRETFVWTRRSSRGRCCCRRLTAHRRPREMWCC